MKASFNSLIYAVLESIICTYVLCSFNKQIDSIYVILIPFLFFIFVYGVFLLFFRHTIPTILAASFFLLVIYLVDVFVFQSRYNHIRLSDVFVIKDALRVARNYRFSFSWETMRIIFVIIALSGGLVGSCLKWPFFSRKQHFFIGLFCVMIPVIFFCLDSKYQFIPNEQEGPGSAFYVPKYGLVWAWYNEYKNMNYNLPEYYSTERAEEILSDYSSIEESEHSEERNNNPQIIVIMNESLTDYSLYSEIQYDDPLRNIHENPKIVENIAVSSVFGGYTPNSEYEFLTGASLMFFPVSSVPYMQYMDRDVFALPWELKNLGYKTKAIHPFYAGEYNRTTAYERLGFDSFLSGDGMWNKEQYDIKGPWKQLFAFGDELEYYRGFISDRECYNAILDSLYQEDDPSFIFAVTIQNHGGYTFSDEDYCEQRFTGNKEVDQYLSCVSESDVAFCEFIERLNDYDRPVIVLMYGDHQPAIDISPYIILEGGFNEVSSQYLVPYFFWSNFDVDYKYPNIVSLNYLSAVLKDAIGFDLNSWAKFRLNSMKTYPVISANVAMHRNGWVNVEEAKKSEEMKRYEIVQDYIVFEK